MLKILRIGLYALGGVFVYIVDLLSFVSLGPGNISNKLLFMAPFGLIGLLAILAAMATNDFKEWRLPVAASLFSGVGVALLVIFTVLCKTTCGTVRLGPKTGQWCGERVTSQSAHLWSYA